MQRRVPWKTAGTLLLLANAGLVAVSRSSSPMAGRTPSIAAMEVRAEIVDAETPSGVMAILRKTPVGEGPWPKVVMFHDGPGIRNATHAFSAKLAGEGYDVLVPDLFHRHGRLIGFEPPRSQEVMDRMMGMVRSLTDDGIQSDLDATLDALGVQPGERLGVIGFCLGARAVFRTLVRFPERFVVGAMWHPSFLVDDTPDSPHLTVSTLVQPLFIGVGDADQVQPIALHQPFFDTVGSLDNVEFEVFPGADHGYTWPDHPTYDEHAATRSFERTAALFEEHLRGW